MQIVLNFKRSTVLKAAAATGLALVLAGAVGSAIAMSPIVQPPIKWQGGAEFTNSIASGPAAIYIVPAGRNFILSDLIVGNPGETSKSFNVYSGAAGSCNSTTLRVQTVVVPAQDTAYVELQTGIGFAAGQAVCIETTGGMSVNGRGFLFTAAPPS